MSNEDDRITIMADTFELVALEYHKAKMSEQGYAVETGITEHSFRYISADTGEMEDLFNGNKKYSITFIKKS